MSSGLRIISLLIRSRPAIVFFNSRLNLLCKLLPIGSFCTVTWSSILLILVMILLRLSCCCCCYWNSSKGLGLLIALTIFLTLNLRCFKFSDWSLGLSLAKFTLLEPVSSIIGDGKEVPRPWPLSLWDGCFLWLLIDRYELFLSRPKMRSMYWRLGPLFIGEGKI